MARVATVDTIGRDAQKLQLRVVLLNPANHAHYFLDALDAVVLHLDRVDHGIGRPQRHDRRNTHIRRRVDNAQAIAATAITLHALHNVGCRRCGVLKFSISLMADWGRWVCG